MISREMIHSRLKPKKVQKMLVKFENDADVTIYVVAQNVAYISPQAGHGSPTIINMAGGGALVVKQDREEVAKRLSEAFESR